MHKEKLEKLKNELTFGVHTLEVTSSVSSKLESTTCPFLNESWFCTRDKFFHNKINPNKTGKGLITNYCELEYEMQSIIEKLGLPEYNIIRVDFSIDNYNSSFDEYLKLNQLFISLLDQKYIVKNRYQSIDFITLENKNVCIKNQSIEAECYNKSLESPRGKVKIRLELRGKNNKEKTILQILELWIKRIDNLAEYYDDLMSCCNTSLIKQWKTEKESGVSKTISEFIRKYQKIVFSRQQLIDFYELLDYTNPKKTAYNFTQRNNIEFISKKDLNDYIEIIKSGFKNFIKST